MEWTKTVEVFILNDSNEFQKVINLPVRLTEQTAIVNDVAHLASNDVFQGKEVELLDVDFLKIIDLPST